MTSANDNIRVLIPLTVRKRNGRPKILPPESLADHQARTQDPHILKAVGRAWAWRRRLEAGEVATIGDLAKAEGFTDRFVSRMVQLAYLSPDVLERMVITRDPPSVSVNEIVEATCFQWAEQMAMVFA